MFDWLMPKGAKSRRSSSTDRRAGRVPHVGKQPRARTQGGQWRRKRSDAGKARAPRKRGLFGF